MELSSRIVHIRISVKEEVIIPPFHHDDVILLFADIDRPIRFIINHDPIECFVLFPSDEYITQVLKLAGTTEWESIWT